jgi:hypothetical protein
MTAPDLGLVLRRFEAPDEVRPMTKGRFAKAAGSVLN